MIKNQAYDNIGHINSFKDEVNETSICSMETELIYSTKVIVDTLARAERMKENFYSRPEGIYKATMALLAGNVNFLLD